MYVNVVVVKSCLYSAESLTLVREKKKKKKYFLLGGSFVALIIWSVKTCALGPPIRIGSRRVTHQPGDSVEELSGGRWSGPCHQIHGRPTTAATGVASHPATKATTLHWRGGWLRSRWIHPGGRAYSPQLQDGGRHSCRMDHPGIGGICPEGGAHSRSRGGRHSGPSFITSDN